MPGVTRNVTRQGKYKYLRIALFPGCTLNPVRLTLRQYLTSNKNPPKRVQKFPVFSGCHRLALFGAVMTGSGAILAVLMFMFCTLITTLLTNISANPTELPGRLAIERHELSCKTTDICTLHVQFYALTHHIQILFFEA